jgi:hypothetical protein
MVSRFNARRIVSAGFILLLSALSQRFHGYFPILALRPACVPRRINIVLNWFEELKGRVPVKQLPFDD